MSKILVSWVGRTDLRAVEESDRIGIGPIAQAINERHFDKIILISDYPESETKHFTQWLEAFTKSPIIVHPKQLTSPMDFGEIHQAVVDVLENILKEGDGVLELTFHLSPGTPAMAAVWIILAKTRFPAELIESSQDHGVRTASVPFDISAEFLPDLLKGPDKRLQAQTASLPPEAPEFDDIIYRSRVMRRLIHKAQKVAVRSVPVLIEGESGTGKELLARAIHRASPRRDKPFVPVNCGAIPFELVESELFGHVKGAFTGADKAKSGYFETADGGSLFLDEVGELPMPTQVKLLRTLQEGEITPLGTTTPKVINVRIIAATNRSLLEETASGAFRSDFFYRLAVAVIRLPSLKERPGDLSLLIDKLAEQVNEESKEEPGYNHKKITASAKNLLIQHPWPGNVRELLNTLRRVAIWADGNAIRSEDVREALIPAGLSKDFDILNRPMEDRFDLQKLMAVVAKHYLSRALDASHGNKTQAAKMLGLSNYQTLTNWLKKYGVDN
jgi:DNA-binding NtrC family response regulator